MRTEQEIREAMEQLKRHEEDPQIFNEANKLSLNPIGHTIRGVMIATLRWTLQEEDQPWKV